ncbi:hypothetical protein ACG7TL_009145 [Trametes sanguinea]
MNEEYESFFHDPLFQSICQDGGLTKQIVTPDHRVDRHPLSHGALPVGDVQDFEHDVDASLAGVNSIDPRLIFPPSQYLSSALFANTPRDDDAATSSSLSAWNCSEGTSPPTSPEYLPSEDVQGCLKANERNPPPSSPAPELSLNEDDLMRLIGMLSDSTSPGASLHHKDGTPLHDFVERDVSAPSYSSPPPESHEHSSPRHPGAAVAGAYGSGDGMRVHPTNTVAVDSRTGWNGAVSSRGDSLTDAGALAPASGVVRRKATAEASPRRQSSEKRTLFCDEPGCSYCAFTALPHSSSSS